MSDRRTLLFYCQHSLGMGHLVRSFGLAEGLAKAFRVVLLNGGRLPEGIRLPRGVEIVQLPPLGMSVDSKLFSHDARYGVEEMQEMRRRAILDTYAELRPRIVLIELFPFGRRKFGFELLPLLEATSETPEKPLVLCSLRDILVSSRRHKQQHDDEAAAVANNFFDGVLVHSDPGFARLEETFEPSFPLRVPLHYTGFVLPARNKRAVGARARRVVVSAGGGIVGGPLLRCALEAQEELWAEARLEMRIIAGPFLPEAEWEELKDAAEAKDGLEVLRSVPDVGLEMGRAAASVSQCGYNTAMDILHSGVPALVVPFAEGREDEQTNRAERLAKLGALRSLAAHDLTAPRLAKEIKALDGFRPEASTLDLSGGANAARLVAGLAG
jgi:predicted glycosyltransferase